MEHDDFPAWEHALLDADADLALCHAERRLAAIPTPTTDPATGTGDDGRCAMCGKWGHGPYVAGVCAGCQQELTYTEER